MVRVSQLAALFTTLIASGSSQVTGGPPHRIITAPPRLKPVDHQKGSTTFEVPCEADDEAFLFTFKLAKHIPLSTPCVETQISLNDRAIQQQWAIQGSGLTGSATTDVSVKSTVNDLNHSLNLVIKSDCDPGDKGSNPLTDPYSDNGHVLQSTVITIDRIDGQVPKSNASFTIVLNASKGRILKVISSEVGEPDQTAAPSSVTPLLDHPAPTPKVDLQHESDRLQSLEGELKQLKQVVEGQKAYVESLLQQRPHEKCPIQRFVDKAKGCAHTILNKITPSHSRSSEHDDCDRDHSRQFSMLASLTGQKHCAHGTVTYAEEHVPGISFDSKESADSSTHESDNVDHEHQNATRSGFSSDGPEKGTQLPTEESKYNNGSTTHPSHHTHGTDEYLLVTLGLVASLLCCGCLVTKLHHRCCNPRAQAERLARREERRTRRQYKCLARRQAWRQWWDRCLNRNTVAASSDYEEKRGLILAQKGILETAMQREIDRLRQAHGYSPESAGAAEEGRVFTESLPAYRSRAGSGRPPSYTSDSNDIRSVTLVTSVASAASSNAGDMSPTRDSTPDSSVACISPRHSSETLRSQRSIV